MRTTDDILKLAARFALHLLYKHQHDMGTFGGSADCCNLWELLQAGLGHVDHHPQVPLDVVIALVVEQVGGQPDLPTVPPTVVSIFLPGKSPTPELWTLVDSLMPVGERRSYGVRNRGGMWWLDLTTPLSQLNRAGEWAATVAQACRANGYSVDVHCNVPDTTIRDEVRKAAEAHAEKATKYEAGGNTRGAMELRRVSNLLYAILRGDWATILP